MCIGNTNRTVSSIAAFTSNHHADSACQIDPEAAAGGNLALLQTGDKVKVDLKNRRVDLLVNSAELSARRAKYVAPEITNDSPWQELYRAYVGQLETGAFSQALPLKMVC